ATARFAGGAARSRIWSEIFAASLDLPLEKPRATELGALGVAIQASVVIGQHKDLASACAAMTGIAETIAPQPDLRERLDRRYAVYRELSTALAPHWAAVTAAENQPATGKIALATSSVASKTDNSNDRQVRITGRITSAG